MIKDLVKKCNDTFKEKFKQYGVSWNYYSLPTLLEQIEVKMYRGVKDNLQVKDEQNQDTWLDIYNYCFITIIKDLQNTNDINNIENVYSDLTKECEQLREIKDKDYDNAWQRYHIKSLFEIALSKLKRIQNIINHSNPYENLTEKHISDLYDIANYSLYIACKYIIKNIPNA